MVLPVAVEDSQAATGSPGAARRGVSDIEDCDEPVVMNPRSVQDAPVGHFSSDRLRQARLAAGLTCEGLARRAGVRSGARVRDWERGAHAPQARYVPQLAAALGVDPVDLYDVDSARPPLRVLRLARGLSLQELAAQAGVSIMTCQRIEQGRGRRLDRTALDRVSQILGVPAG